MGDVRVVALGATPLTSSELSAHIAEAAQWRSTVRCVVVEVQPGGALSARDRVALGEAGLLATPVAVLVESKLTRSILTAVSWLGGNMAAFAPDALEAACEHLEIPSPQRDAIAHTLAMLRPQVS